LFIRLESSGIMEEMEIGHYRIIGCLGKGGMGEVFLAEHKYLNETVAIKTIRKAGFYEDVLKHLEERFDHEARIQRQLQHDHIVRVENYFIQDESFYLVLEYLPGYNYPQSALADHSTETAPTRKVIRTVADELRMGPIHHKRALSLFKQILQALDYAHNKEFKIKGERLRGLIHRDIKPANFLFADRDTVKLGDFGIVKVPGYSAGTKTGVSPGTWAYMSPEAIEGKRLDARSDIYSLGCSLFEMLTGQTPFGRGSEAVVGHLNNRPPLARSVRSDIPEALDDFIQRALKKRPEDRFQSVAEMLKEIERIEEQLRAQEYSETVTEPLSPTVLEPPEQGVGSEEKQLAQDLPCLADRMRSVLGKPLARWVLGTIGVAVIVLAVIKDGPPTPPLSTKIDVRIVVQGGMKPPSDCRTFRSGEKVRLVFTTSREGYCYIILRSADQSLQFLFPNPLTNQGSARVEKDQTVAIPGRDKYFTFDQKPGYEELFIVHAPDPNSVSKLEEIYQIEVANPKNRNLNIDVTRAPAVQEFLNSIRTRGVQEDLSAPCAELFKINYQGGKVAPSLVKLVLRHE
jgi:serine/threonine protein kinase